MPAPARGQPVSHQRSSHWRGHGVALNELASVLLQELALRLALDAFGHDLEAQPASNRNHVGHDRRVRRVVGDGASERAVQLDGVDREVTQIAQRRETGAEVVDRQPDPSLAQRGQPRAGHLWAREDGFGQLQLEQAGVQTAAVERTLDGGVEGGRPEGVCRDVDGHAQQRRALPLPRLRLLTRRFEHPAVDLSFRSAGRSPSDRNSPAASSPRRGCDHRSSASTAATSPPITRTTGW